jgi:RsiW-degrading membrane proteinase PrsW (M82 family)
MAMYLKFKFSIHSFKNIRNAVLLGAIGVLLLLLANYLIELKWGGNLRNMRRMAFYVFVIIAFSSELAKFIALRKGFFNLKSFEGPLEGIVYSVFIGLGFSTIATLLFAFGIVGADTKFNDITLFLYAYPFASFVFGVVMGFFIGMGQIRKNGLIDSTTGLFVATFFHGLFYFSFITSDKRLLIFAGIGFTVITITLILKAVYLRANRN